MLTFMVPLILCLATCARSYRYDTPRQSVASEAQIRFAIENKYDDTGPGAKTPDFAYNTYKTLDDALIAYLDDPDTKLPEHDRNRAIHKLVHKDYEPVQRYQPKTVEEYTGYKQEYQKQQEYSPFLGRQPTPQAPIVLTKINVPKKQYLYGYQDSLKSLGRYRDEPYRLQRIQPVRGNPLSLAHYSRDSDVQNAHEQFNPHPKYTFSYGVNVPDTGDHKSAQETREGGTVRGYYSFLDADGAQRTVHYTADDQQGFQATVERSQQ